MTVKTKKTAIVIFFKDTQAIWGIFTSEKKAIKALNWWGGLPVNDFYYMTYTVDYRGHKGAIGRYVSDVPTNPLRSLADLNGVPIMATSDTKPLVRDDNVSHTKRYDDKI
jgi:hypothetical protein